MVVGSWFEICPLESYGPKPQDLNVTLLGNRILVVAVKQREGPLGLGWVLSLMIDALIRRERCDGREEGIWIHKKVALC